MATPWIFLKAPHHMPLAPAMSTKANTLTGQSHLKKYSESAIEQILNFFKQAQYNMVDG